MIDALEALSYIKFWNGSEVDLNLIHRSLKIDFNSQEEQCFIRALYRAQMLAEEHLMRDFRKESLDNFVDDVENDIFVKKSSISTSTPISRARQTAREEELDSELLFSSDADLEDIFEVRREESPDRLGWLGEEEVVELFGIPMSTIKRTTRAWWKQHEDLLSPDRRYNFDDLR